MNDKELKLKELKGLSDDRLQGLMGDIARALGTDPRKAQSLNVSKVRATLENISDEEAKRLIEKAGKDKAEEIYRAIQRRSN